MYTVDLKLNSLAIWSLDSSPATNATISKTVPTTGKSAQGKGKPLLSEKIKPKKTILIPIAESSLHIFDDFGKQKPFECSANK